MNRIIENELKDLHTKNRDIVICTSRNNAKKLVEKAVEKVGLFHLEKKSKTSLIHKNGGKIKFITPEEIDRLRGRQLDAFYYERGALETDDVNTIVVPAIQNKKGDIILVSKIL